MMTRKPHVDSYYAESAVAAPVHPALEEHIRCDVCIVGAGITGCSTALHLAERGYDVVVLESSRIGWGASGRSGGQKIFGFSCDMASIRRLSGDVIAQHLWDLSVEAIELVDEQIKKYDIQCDLRTGHLHAAIKPRQREELRIWKAELEDRYGYDGLEILEGDALRRTVDTQRYLAGLYDPRSGHLHPLNYTLGLAAAATRAGARIFEGSLVLEIEETALPMARAAGGAVVCDHMVLCTNAYLDGLDARLQRRMVPVGSHIAATEPLGEERARRLLPTGMAVADLNCLLDYYRLSADHRLLFGSRIGVRSPSPSALRQGLRARMLRVFPQLADVAIDYVWGGDVAVTRNSAPDWGRVTSNIYYAQGYSGHGIALSGFAGKLMAEAIAGNSERFDLFTKIPHDDIPISPWLRTPALALAMLWYRLRDAL